MKKIYWIPICLLLVLAQVVIAYVMVTESALDQVVKTFEKTYKVEKGKDTTNMMRVPGYLKLLQERSHLSSQLQLAKSDSVELSLRLQEHVARLVVKGVAVAEFPLQDVGVSPLFERLSPESLYELLSEPWVITGSVSTISREPLNVIQAPKDSTEIAPFVEPDTTHSEPVFFTWKTNKGVDLYFYQMEEESENDRTVGRQIAKREALEQFWLFVDAAKRWVIPSYSPSIRIGMRKVDAKVLYRALPAKGLVAITF